MHHFEMIHVSFSPPVLPLPHGGNAGDNESLAVHAEVPGSQGGPVMVPGIDPKVDYAFKRLFGREPNQALSIHLLNAVLAPPPHERVVDLELLNPFNDKDRGLIWEHLPEGAPMAEVDPFIPLRDWRSSLYRGDPVVLDRFLDTIDATLPPGWVRDTEYERTRLRPDRIRCYVFDRAGDAAVRAWLQRVTATRVRGGPVQVLRHPPSGDAAQIGRLVAEFTDTCVLPAARAAGTLCTRPAFGPRSAVTPAAELLLTRFADTADGQWPLSEQAQRLWDELISSCLGEQVAIDRAELARWLADSGWEQAAVTPMADRFFADSEWLAKRLEVTAP
jgi:hypothetical protein